MGTVLDPVHRLPPAEVTGIQLGHIQQQSAALLRDQVNGEGLTLTAIARRGPRL